MISEHASPLAPLGGVDSGGQNTYVRHVARQLQAAGCRVDVFTRRDGRDLPDVFDTFDGYRVIHVPAGPPTRIRKEDVWPHMPEFADYVRRWCRRQRYDVVHANFWMSGAVAVELKRTLGLPFAVTFHALGRVRRAHQGADDGFPDERVDVEERVMNAADRIIAECPQDFEDLVALYGADPDKICVIPCGFDDDELWPMPASVARTALGIAPDERVLLQLGRMVPRKGVDNVIRALGRLVRDHGIEARLLIVGGDEDAADELRRLRAIAEDEAVASLVDFRGACERDTLKYYYGAADVFLTTPHYEPFGITPVEAMACGTPVIGANVGGIKHTIRDGETGYLVPPRAPDVLAERVAFLYRHPALLTTFRANALRHASERFTWRRVAGEIDAVFDDMLAARAGHHPPARYLSSIDRAFAGTDEALQGARRRLPRSIVAAAELLAETFARGGKLLICGNGGSAADAQHFAAEFIGSFRVRNRQALPAIALTSDTAVLTAWSNDCAFEDVFARQVQALGCDGDALIGISTSGQSPNVIRAFERARRLGLRTVALLGGNGGRAATLADLAVTVPSADTQRVQETHIVLIHIICELVEEMIAQRARDPRALPRPARRAAPAPPGRRDGPVAVRSSTEGFA
jgi:phosphoheptose isomerase